MMFSDSFYIRRKSIFTLHDTTRVYVVAALFSLLVFFFSLSGIGVASTVSEYEGYVWVPAFLLVASGTLFTASAARLVTRLFFGLQEKFTDDGLGPRI